MSGIKTLAKQTAWYGASNILSRFLNYLLTPLLTSVFASADYGKISTLFAYAAFLNIVFTYGLETAYFRFIQQEPEKKVFNTAFSSILISTLLITSVLWFSSDAIASFLEMPSHPEYIRWMLLIVAFDTFAVMPFPNSGIVADRSNSLSSNHQTSSSTSDLFCFSFISVKTAAPALFGQMYMIRTSELDMF